MWRTTAVHRWEITGSPCGDAAPELPAEVDRDDVQGTADGTGPLLHRIYRTGIVGSGVGPEELVERIAADLDRIAPSRFATFQKLDGEGPLALGDEYVVRMPGPWDGPVRAVAVRPDAFRLATLTGHLEAGQIEFRARADHRALEFTIESWARSGDRLSDLMYTQLRLAKEVQLHMWTSVLERVVKLAEGTMSGGVVITTRRVEAARLHGEGPGATSRRSTRRLAELSQRRVNFDVSRIAEYTRSTDWQVDDMVEPLPHEPSGPPLRGGVWETARRLVVDYQLADPGVLRALYRHDAPLEGRDMLLRIRFLGLRFAVGVRVGEVYEEERELGGRRAKVFGWAYRTLEGHFEQGEMHYQVWKWLDSGDVEFRLHAVSRAADSGPLVPRTGFRLAGRISQLRFYRQTCRRVRRLTEAELETNRAAETA
ncbi:MAG: DUF1990 domain-containing protein [Actinomycetota bacterium]|nr:DUF1990 domain-containing protein [Actinomycetota bacterium]